MVKKRVYSHAEPGSENTVHTMEVRNVMDGVYLIAETLQDGEPITAPRIVAIPQALWKSVIEGER